jgi:hypothetical protein
LSSLATGFRNLADESRLATKVDLWLPQCQRGERDCRVTSLCSSRNLIQTLTCRSCFPPPQRDVRNTDSMKEGGPLFHGITVLLTRGPTGISAPVDRKQIFNE